MGFRERRRPLKRVFQVKPHPGGRRRTRSSAAAQSDLRDDGRWEGAGEVSTIAIPVICPFTRIKDSYS